MSTDEVTEEQVREASRLSDLPEMVREEMEPRVTDSGSQDLWPDTLLADITWRVRSSSGWGYRNNKVTYTLSDTALNSLEQVGISRVEDLEGMSKTRLQDFSGVGSVAAERLIMAAKRCNVAYRGAGFPAEVRVRLIVPADAREAIEEFSQDEAQEALEAEINASDFFDAVRERIIERQIETLEQEEAELEQEIEELRQQLQGES